MRYQELFEHLRNGFNPNAWGHWITPWGEIYEVGDDHGHAKVYYEIMKQELPLNAEGKISNDIFYNDQREARENGWIWLRSGNREQRGYGTTELSVAFTKPSKVALNTLHRILPTFKNYDAFYINAWFENSASMLYREFIQDLRKLTT